MACPSGAHLPSEYEWSVLLNRFSKPSYEGYSVYFSLVGNQLKSKDGWLGRDIGENAIGFNVYPTGYVFNDKFMEYGYLAEYWTSTAAGDDSVRVVRLVANDHYAVITNESNKVFLPVRCVIGDTLVPESSSSAYVPGSSSDAVVKPSGAYDCLYNECVTEQNLDPDKTYMDVLDDRENKVYTALFEKMSAENDLGLAFLLTGFYNSASGSLVDVGYLGGYWTSTDYKTYAFTYMYVALYITGSGETDVTGARPSEDYMAVRCVREVNLDEDP